MARKNNDRMLLENLIHKYGKNTIINALNELAEQKEIKDLANMPAASLGKSQVASDSIEGDLKFLEKNPELVAKLNQVIDEYAANHSEEETLQMIEKMHQEFVAKK